MSPKIWGHFFGDKPFIFWKKNPSFMPFFWFPVFIAKSIGRVFQQQPILNLRNPQFAPANFPTGWNSPSVLRLRLCRSQDLQIINGGDVNWLGPFGSETLAYWSSLEPLCEFSEHSIETPEKRTMFWSLDWGWELDYGKLSCELGEAVQRTKNRGGRQSKWDCSANRCYRTRWYKVG